MRIGTRDSWRALGLVIVVSGSVALASMAVVRLRNADRGDTTAVEWALDDLHVIPESTLTLVCQPGDFHASVDRYRAGVQEHRIPVDSIRDFYQLYARLARDGRIDPREVRQLGQYLGFPVHDPHHGTDDER